MNKRLPLFAQLAAMAMLGGIAPVPRRPEEEQPLSLGMGPSMVGSIGARSVTPDPSPPLLSDVETPLRRVMVRPRLPLPGPRQAGPDLSPAPGHKGRSKGTRRSRKAGRK